MQHAAQVRNPLRHPLLARHGHPLSIRPEQRDVFPIDLHRLAARGGNAGLEQNPPAGEVILSVFVSDDDLEHVVPVPRNGTAQLLHVRGVEVGVDPRETEERKRGHDHPGRSGLPRERIQDVSSGTPRRGDPRPPPLQGAYRRADTFCGRPRPGRAGVGSLPTWKGLLSPGPGSCSSSNSAPKDRSCFRSGRTSWACAFTTRPATWRCRSCEETGPDSRQATSSSARRPRSGLPSSVISPTRAPTWRTKSTASSCITSPQSLFPNWVGTDQVRFYRISGDRLIVGAPTQQVGGHLMDVMLVWERLAPIAGA